MSRTGPDAEGLGKASAKRAPSPDEMLSLVFDPEASGLGRLGTLVRRAALALGGYRARARRAATALQRRADNIASATGPVLRGPQ